MEKIFVRGTNWIGDAVMSIPCLKELRRLYPDAHVALAVRPWVAPIYTHADYVDEVLLYDKEREQRGMRRWAWIRQLRERRYDTALLLQNAFEAAALAFLARIPRRIGYCTDSRGWTLTDRLTRRPPLQPHQIYYYLDLLTLSGLSPIDYQSSPEYRPDISIRLPRQLRYKARKLLVEAGIQPEEWVVGVNPGAFFGSAKRWFPERYAELADRLTSAYGARILLLGSPSEKSLAEMICQNMKSKPVVFTGKTTLEELMGLLGCCRLLVTNDSGPMHLGAALGVPLLALFGSTDERATGPYSDCARLIHKHVECSPCLLRECPIDLRCFDRISVDEVFKECRSILETQAGRDGLPDWNKVQ